MDYYPEERIHKRKSRIPPRSSYVSHEFFPKSPGKQPSIQRKAQRLPSKRQAVSTASVVDVSLDWVGKHSKWLGILLIFIVVGVAAGFLLTPKQQTQTHIVGLPLLENNWVSGSVEKQSIEKAVKPETASMKIRANFQGDRIHYETDEQYENWWRSTCSAFSYMAVFNAYGHFEYANKGYEVTKKEAELGVWNPRYGLTFNEVNTGKISNAYGFEGSYSRDRSMDKIIDIANSGYPVVVGIIGWVNGYYFNHVLVIRGGTNEAIFVVDSSERKLTNVERRQFTKVWQAGGHHSHVIWPKNITPPQL